jgi:hypothetical protein
VGSGDVRRAQAAERFQHARPGSRRQRCRGADDIRVLRLPIRPNGRPDVERGLNRSESLRVSGALPGCRPQPMPSHPGDVAAHAECVESREGAEDPEQRILRQVIRGVLVELTCKEPHEQRPQLDHQCIDRARLALLC